MANALLSEIISKCFLDNVFWPTLLNSAYTTPKPGYLPYTSMQDYFFSNIDDNYIQTEIDRILITPDTHSNFSHIAYRLSNNLIKDIPLPSYTNSSPAVNYYIDDNVLLKIHAQFDRVWLISSKLAWDINFKTGLEEQLKLTKLHNDAINHLLTNESAHEYLSLISKYLSKNDYNQHYNLIIYNNISDANLFLLIGKHYLDNLDSNGLKILEVALEHDKSLTLSICQLITKYYVRLGQPKNAQMYRRKALAFQVEAA